MPHDELLPPIARYVLTPASIGSFNQSSIESSIERKPTSAGLYCLMRTSLDESIIHHSTRGYLKAQSPETSSRTPSSWPGMLLQTPTLSRPEGGRIQWQPQHPASSRVFPALPHRIGAWLYGGAMGIRREDQAGRKAAVLRNFDFFGAPTVAIVAMDKRFGAPDSLSIGMYSILTKACTRPNNINVTMRETN